MRHTARDGTRGIRKIDVLSHHAGGEYLLPTVCVQCACACAGGGRSFVSAGASDAWGSGRVGRVVVVYNMVVVVVVVVRTSPAYVIHPKIAVPVLAASHSHSPLAPIRSIDI